MCKNLKNKVAVVTGGSSGLGKELATLLVKEGAKVIICARSKKELKKAAGQTGAEPFVADVTKKTDIFKLAKFAIKKYKKIDIWVNNAGIWAPHSTIEGLDIDLTHQMLEVNFFGTIYGSQAALKVMKKQKQGVIANVVSFSALRGRPMSAGYSASKWAVRGFTEALKLAAKPQNISVVAIYPSGFKSKIFGKNQPGDYSEFMETSFVASEIVKNFKKDKPKSELIINTFRV